MKIAIGSDHAGFAMKEYLLEAMRRRGIEMDDLGTHGTESVDYPDYGAKVARSVVSGRHDLGVLVCGTGIGISMAANKVPGARAAVCWDISSARLSRQHNDANVLCLSGRLMGEQLAEDILVEWLQTPFSGGERHMRRIAKLAELDKLALEESGS